MKALVILGPLLAASADAAVVVFEISDRLQFPSTLSGYLSYDNSSIERGVRIIDDPSTFFQEFSLNVQLAFDDQITSFDLADIAGPNLTGGDFRVLFDHEGRITGMSVASNANPEGFYLTSTELPNFQSYLLNSDGLRAQNVDAQLTFVPEPSGIGHSCIAALTISLYRRRTPVEK